MSDENATVAAGDSAASNEPKLEGGAYEIIRRRLEEQADQLGGLTTTLNEQRLEVFGGIDMSVLGQMRVRTENNCVPRDIVIVHGKLLFGYNVYIGLKKETHVGDVLSLHRLAPDDDGELEFVDVDAGENFLTDPKFVKDFTELYTYYKESKLLQLRVVGGKLLVVFQVGERTDDVKVFRWNIESEENQGIGGLTYMDNRGERDHVFPPSHDFEWTETNRDQFVQGRHPHVNILDEVFVETVGGDLTVKVEDNTDDGKGIYSEDVDDKNQSLADAQILYAKLGALILLKILPYRETDWRYLVFNTRSQDVKRIDAIGLSCVQLPEDHGIIFPGGYYLQSGETKTFEGDAADMRFMHQVRSPNGEDVLFDFYRVVDGHSVLLPYNLINKEVDNPIRCHGSAIFDDGKLVVFRADDEPTRVHHMQVWQTAYMSSEEAARLHEGSEHASNYLTKVGNPDLVRGISDCASIRRAIKNQQPSMAVYEDLIKSCARILDAYHWLGRDEVGNIAAKLHEVQKTAELVIDEFEKVIAMQASASEALAEAEEKQGHVLLELRPETWKTVDHFVDAMAQLRTQRGHLITLKEMRYIDVERIDVLEKEVSERFEYLSDKAAEFLTGDDALTPYHEKNASLLEAIEGMAQARDAEPIEEEVDGMSTQLDLLTEVVGTLQIDDANARTRILEDISSVFALVNRTRATLVSKRKSLMSAEGVAEFGAQFKLFAQSVQSALGLCDTPERCDEQLTRLMVQLEELEGRFSEFDEFLADLAQKREEVYETLSNKKQQLLEERQRRAQNLGNAADRILTGIARRAGTIKDVDELNAYFASDAMVIKVKDLATQLLDLGDTVRAEDVSSRIKRSREDAIRQLRDKSDLFDEEGGDNVIKFGKHRFTVNTQPLDLTLLPRGDSLALHLTGTDFYEQVDDEHTFGERLFASRNFWNRTLVSETDDVARAEHLAASILFAAERQEDGLSLDKLHKAALDKSAGDDDEHAALADIVKQVAGNRYDEGYDRGVHDSDATVILDKLLGLYSTSGLLRFSPTARALGCLFWAFFDDEMVRKRLHQKGKSLGRLQEALGPSKTWHTFCAEIEELLRAFVDDNALDDVADVVGLAASYLAEELRNDELHFVTSSEAQSLLDLFTESLDAKGVRAAFADDIAALDGDLKSQLQLARAWVNTFLDEHADDESGRVDALRVAGLECVVLQLTERKLERTSSTALSAVDIDGLLSSHKRVTDGKMQLRLDEFLVRMQKHFDVDVPGFQQFRELRTELLQWARDTMRLDEFKPRVLSSFVRNKLINEVYLPLIGDNLAKQMGAVGAKKRTDLMGLLLLISPPGYGKTTLMEYVASRLGLTFMKVNGPSLGHEVVSLDPAEAPNATARQEVEKINLAFEMGNNVMLYLDDIQHTHPELLQKFISLCDGSRRVEGVWKGKTRTYDLRGKKFCVVMAGNPYTESGDRFQIPDMLSNRADTYNLGDILGGQQDAFALSYVENSLTSNPVLQPLATRDPQDVYLFVRMARGEEIPTTDLKHGYSGVEVDEIVKVMQKLLACQKVLLDVNAEYIRSASMEDKYRTEPAFKLQGSYRNMNKLAEKVVAVMNDDELEQLIDDHYGQESQTLTTGAEQNLLKLAEMRQRMSDEQVERWALIKENFARNQMMGGDDDDPISRVTSTLAALAGNVEDMSEAVVQAQSTSTQAQGKLTEELSQLRSGVLAHGKASRVFDDNRMQTDLAQQAKLLEELVQLKTTLAQAAKLSAQATQKASAQTAEAQANVLQPLVDAVAGTELTVQVQAPTPPLVDETLKTQAQLLKGTVVPLLQTLKAIAHHLANEGNKPAQIDMSQLDSGMKKLMQGLGAIYEKIDDIKVVGEPGMREEVYRPFKPKGTRAD